MHSLDVLVYYKKMAANNRTVVYFWRRKLLNKTNLIVYKTFGPIHHGSCHTTTGLDISAVWWNDLCFITVPFLSNSIK